MKAALKTAEGTFDVTDAERPILTHRFSLDQINGALDTADREDGASAVFVAISI